MKCSGAVIYEISALEFEGHGVDGLVIGCGGGVWRGGGSDCPWPVVLELTSYTKSPRTRIVNFFLWLFSYGFTTNWDNVHVGPDYYYDFFSNLLHESWISVDLLRLCRRYALFKVNFMKILVKGKIHRPFWIWKIQKNNLLCVLITISKT